MRLLEIEIRIAVLEGAIPGVGFVEVELLE
jgi:hypothetical protein